MAQPYLTTQSVRPPSTVEEVIGPAETGVGATSHPVTFSLPATPAQIEQPRKPRGRQRLLRGIRRMASSTSLTRAGASAARAGDGYTGLGRGSMSCISLSSPPVSSSPSMGLTSYGTSHHRSSSSQGYLSTGTSTPAAYQSATTNNNAPLDMRWHDKPRFRIISRPLSKSRPATPLIAAPLTAPLPSDLRFGHVIHQTGSEASASSTSFSSGAQTDYFSLPTESHRQQLQRQLRPNFDFWGEMPAELKIRIMGFLQPKEIVRASAVSKAWHSMCYDGQLWRSLDFSEIYQQIPAESLIKILTEAGPFVKDLNLRGCVQLRDRWQTDGQNISDLCRNMEHFSLKDCKIDRRTVHFFILRNPRLVHVDLSGVTSVNNVAMSILGQNCPQLQYLDVSWCPKIDTAGLEEVVTKCRQLKDLRAGKMDGWSSESWTAKSLLLSLFENNKLERLALPHCTDLDDEALMLLIQGRDPLINPLTGHAIVPPRTIRHLDLTGCKQLTNKSVKSLHAAVPELQSLCLHGCSAVTDDALIPLFSTVPNLTHLDLEELTHISNATLTALAAAPCAPHLRHLSLSYCENVGDTGVMPIVKACTRLRNLEVDNTRIGNLTLHEAAAVIHDRNMGTNKDTASGKPELGLRLVAYDCANVTWTGILAVLEKNAEFFRRPLGSTQAIYPCEVINLKCFYGFQPTVDEHTKRVLKGELAKATMLARKWHDWMQATEEAGVQGAGGWRRRMRAREAERQMEGEGTAGDGMPGRRRARSGGCVVM